MKTLFKLLAGLLVIAVLGLAALGIQLWYFKPLSIDVFFERVFIQYALDDPELLSSLRIVEQFGLDSHNKKLTDVSPAHQEKQAQFARENLDTLRAYDRARLSAQQQLSYDVLEWFLRDAVEGERWQYHNYPVNQLFGVQNNLPEFMATIHQINNAGDARNYLTRLSKFGEKFNQLLEGLRLRENRGILPPKFVIEKVLTEMRGFIAQPAEQNILYTTLKEKLAKLDQEPQPQREQLLAEGKREIEQTVYPAYGQLIKYFETIQPKVTENYGVWKLPDGDAYYAYAVKSQTTTDLDPETIHNLGLAEVARIEQEMDAILKSQGMNEGSLGARIQKLNGDPRFLYSNDDRGRAEAIAGYQKIIDDMNAGLGPYFNLRPQSGVKVERIAEFKEKTAPGAYYNPPAMDGSRPGTFFINLRDMKEIVKWGMRTLAYHEAIPGHHFQLSIAQELTGVPTFRKILPFTAYAEGWALYSERLAREIGFENDPYDNLGRLQAEMFRAVRLVVDTGIHRKRWTREQAIAYMIEKTGMSQSEVVSEIERYFVMPGQALAYKVGMLKILELREKARTALGPKFDIRQFHDVVLKNGALPLEILEQQVKHYIDQARAGK